MPGVGAVRYSELRQGGSVVLARHGGTTLAYVADEDSRAIHTIDLAKKEQIARTSVGGAPAQVLVLSDGRVAVSLRDNNQIEILEPGIEPSAPLTSLCKRVVPDEPIGLAATADDKNVLVTSGWGKALTALNAETLAPSFGVDLPREPRAVVVDDSGERAFVSHAVGAKLSVIDLTEGGAHEVRSVDTSVTTATPFVARNGNSAEIRRSASQGFALAKSVEGTDTLSEQPPVTGKAPAAPKAPSPEKTPKAPLAAPKGRIFLPMVTVSPGDPNVRSQAYYGESRDGVAKEAPMVNVIDAAAERSMTRSVMSLGTPVTAECLLPRAAAARGSSGTLFVTCLGADSLVELDTRGSDPIRLERRRWSVPAGPTGLAIDDAGSQAVVWSQYEGTVSVVDLSENSTTGVELVAVSYEPTAEVTQIAWGRQLFHTTDDLRIANDGVACASCHPDGRDDSITWSTPEGPRQTIMLAGRSANTAPYGWQGKHGDLKAYLGNTFSRLGGSGIKGAELEAMIKYLEKMPAPPRNGELSEVAAQGKDLFHDTTLGCAGCHVAGSGVDKVTHDVGSKAIADLEQKFDTPSLLFVKGTAPYFHDGRYKTLDDMLAAKDNEMGHTLHLTARQRTALGAYLGTL